MVKKKASVVKKKASAVKEILVQLFICIINANKKLFCVNKIFGQDDLIFGTK